MFATWGRLVCRFRWLVLLLSLATLIAAVALIGYGGVLGGGDFAPQTEAGKTQKLLKKELPNDSQSINFIFSSGSLKATDPAFQREVDNALEPLKKNAQVREIRTAYNHGTIDEGMISKDGKRTYAIVDLRGSEKELQGSVPEIERAVRSNDLEVLTTGELALNHDFGEFTQADLQRAEVVSLPLALLMLLLIFGSLIAAGIPIGVGILVIAVGFTGTLLLARVTDVSFYATNIVTMIGLGLTIDYSLFIVSRFREEVSLNPVPESLSRTMATAGRSVTFSGLTVATGLAGFMFFHLGDLRSIGIAGAIVVALAIFYGLSFLPALLAILGSRVNALRVPFVHPGSRLSGRGFWYHFSNGVMARPWRVLLSTVALLLVLGLPLLNLRLGLEDVTSLPESSEARKGTELLEKQFDQGDSNRTVVVLNYPDGQPLSPEHVGQTYEMSRWLGDLSNVSYVQSVVNLDPAMSEEQYRNLLSRPQNQLPREISSAIDRSIGKHVAVLNVYTSEGTSTQEKRDLVDAIREEHPPISGQVQVTGQSAFEIDTVNSVADDAPLAIAFVVGATFLVLFLLLRSILLPLKAVLMNFLSISASYGALVWIFQEGHLSDWLGFTSGPINTTIPVIMFCILFGLSMDYEVLLLSRIKEEYERTGNNQCSIASGLEQTGRLITGAAAIMAVVFFSFGLADTVLIKALGLGLGIAVVVDATIVRALLVPATMRLMGRWNWWAPKPLAALHAWLCKTEPNVESSGEVPSDKAITGRTP